MDPLSQLPLSRLTAAVGRRYTVERELGRGGMGTVYLALDRKHDRPVALKVLPPEIAAAMGPERFLREIRIAAQLNHPHILPVHDSGESRGILYFVMPYVEGESLRTRIARERQLPVGDAIEIAQEIADALGHAHACGVIHRDIKPENILLSGGHALLADFGVAKAMPTPRGKQEVRTDSGLAVGTATYASPEQAAGSREVDHRSDIYSLGCVLYEMLVGEPPGGGLTASQILENRFAVIPPPARSFRPEVPVWVDRALLRALAANPAERLASAADFRDALSASTVMEAHTPASVPPESGAPRRPQLIWMGTGAATLVLIGAALAFMPRHTAKLDPRQVVVAGFENKTGDPALAPVGDIASDYIARGLAATRLMHEVYDVRLTAREAGDSVRRGAAAGLALAHRVHAGTVLWGSYYRDGDSLHFEAQLVDGATGKLVVPLQPSVGLLRDKTRVVELLRQRVMAGFATVFGSEFDTWKAASLPPTYDAYQEMLAAGKTEFDFAAAVEHYRRAAALDTSFTGAQTSAAVVLSLEDDCSAVDSIGRRLEPRERQLPPVDRAQLRLARASCQGDTDAALEAVRAALGAAPRSIGLAILGAVVAVEHLRPRAALEMLQMVNPEKIGAKGFLSDVYFDWLGMTYHMLGDYRRELSTRPWYVGKSSEQPDADPSALAALGRTREAERIAIGYLPQRHTSDDPWPAPMHTECVALELRAHGHPMESQRVFQKVVAWYGSAITDATREDFPCARGLFSSFYYTGRWEEARAGYEHLLAQDSASVKAHAALGALAVRRGDQVEAARMDTWLAQRQNPGASYARARLAALRGDRDEAVSLVRQALHRGLRGVMFLHLDPDFESLRDYPPYRELIRPKL
jgi:tetratricopeptide (TPR) repeat protein/TolB-like protein